VQARRPHHNNELLTCFGDQPYYTAAEYALAKKEPA